MAVDSHTRLLSSMQQGKPKSRSLIPPRLRFWLPLLACLAVSVLVAAQVCSTSRTQMDGVLPQNMRKHFSSSSNLMCAIRDLALVDSWYMSFNVAWMSGLWPYTMILGMLLCVYTSDRGLAGRRYCRHVLSILGSLMKWTLSYVFLICFNAIIFDISVPKFDLFPHAWLPDGGALGKYAKKIQVASLEMELWVNLCPSTILFLFVTVLGVFMAHWSVWELTPKSSRHDVEDEVESKPRSWCFCVSMVLMCLISAIFLLVGVGTPLVSFGRSGLLGKLMSAQSKGYWTENRNIDLSLGSMVYLLGDLSEHRGVTTVGILSFVLGLTVFVAPLVQLTLIMVTVCSHRFSSRICYWAHAGAEWIYSFNCTTVFLNLLLAIAWRPDVLVKWNIGAECKVWDMVVRNSHLLGQLGKDFASGAGAGACLDLTANLHNGFYLLLAGDALLHAVSWQLGRISTRPQAEIENEDPVDSAATK